MKWFGGKIVGDDILLSKCLIVVCLVEFGVEIWVFKGFYVYMLWIGCDESVKWWFCLVSYLYFVFGIFFGLFKYFEVDVGDYVF